MAQLMPLPLTVSCFSKIQIGFTFLVLAHPGGPGKKGRYTGVCMYVKPVACICGNMEVFREVDCGDNSCMINGIFVFTVQCHAWS